MQLSALHTHGAVLGPLHTVRTALLLLSLHKQLAVELHTILFDSNKALICILKMTELCICLTMNVHN